MFGLPNYRLRGRRHVGLALALVGALVAGCGSSDDDSTATVAATGTQSTDTDSTAVTDTGSSTVSAATEPAAATASTDAAAGATSAPPTDATAPSTRTVEHAGGITDIPADAERILVLDDYAGFVVLQLGAEPAAIYGSYFTQSIPEVAALTGIEISPHNVEEPSIESAAELGPDLIIGSDHPGTLRNYDLWSGVAPTVLIEYSGAWQDQVDIVGQALGSDDAAQRVEAIDDEIDALAQRIADEYDSPPTVSLIASLQGMPFAIPETGSATGELLQRLGLERPTVQQVEGDPAFPFSFFSQELLLDHDADFVVTAGGGIYEDMTSLDLWPALTGTTAVVSGDEWLATHPFAIAWMLADIESLLFGDGSVGTVDDTVERWNDFIAIGS